MNHKNSCDETNACLGSGLKSGENIKEALLVGLEEPIPLSIMYSRNRTRVG